MPQVSVIIPTYNRRTFVQQAIDSVLAQTYTDYEIIVVDDGSTDGTGEALAARYGDRIRYVWQENQGESVARNCGIETSRAEYVAFLDSDDMWLPAMLRRLLAFFETKPEVAMVFCQKWLMDSSARQLDTPPQGLGLEPADWTLERLCLENPVSLGAVLIRRSTLEQVGGFDPSIEFGEDWDLWLRLRRHWDFAFLPEPLTLIRVHLNTQCHFPRAENVERVLSDHIRLLEKAFMTWPESAGALEPVRRRALARQYGEAAFACYAWNLWSRGRDYLASACGLDPSIWRDRTHLTQTLVRYAIAITGIEGKFDVTRMRSFLGGTLSNLPSCVALPHDMNRQILGKLCAEEAYRHYKSGERAKTRYFTWQAVRADPSWLRDKGMIRRVLEP